MRGAPPSRRNPARRLVHAQDRRGRALRTFQMCHAQPLMNPPFVFLKRGPFPARDGIFIRGRHLLRSPLFTFHTGARPCRIPRPAWTYVKKLPPQKPTALLSARKTLLPAQNHFFLSRSDTPPATRRTTKQGLFSEKHRPYRLQKGIARRHESATGG